MSSSIFEKIWTGSFIEDQSHLEEVRKLFLDNLLEENANTELEQSASLSDYERVKTLKKYFSWTSARKYSNALQKSAELSVQLREKANEFYKKGNLYEAMRGYNLAIAFGCPGESELGLAYGNRAAVFLSLKKPFLAIQDISLALQNKYPLELQEKLIQRRSKCETMNNSTTNPTAAAAVSPNEFGSNPTTLPSYCAQPNTLDEDTLLFQKHIFSLKSPSAHVTHAEDFVQIDYDEKCGRRLVVTKEVPSGTPLLLEDPYVVALSEELRWDMNHCHHCSIRIQGGIPCPSCTFGMYCSFECQMNSMNGRHKYEHNLFPYFHCHKMEGKELLVLHIITTAGPGELFKLFKSGLQGEKHSVLSHLRGVKGNSVYGSSYAEIYSFIGHPDKIDLREKVSNAFKALIITNLLNEASDFFKSNLEHKEPEFMDFIASLILHHLENVPYNSFALSELQSDDFISGNSKNLPTAVTFATGLLATVSLVNHSCCPNAIHVRNPKFCKSAFLAMRRLYPGDEVRISYGPNFIVSTRLERRAKLEETYKFICQCQACEENWPREVMTLEDLMEAHKCPSSKCSRTSKVMCNYCMEILRNLTIRYDQFERELHQAHDYIMSGNKSEALKAFEILTHCLNNFEDFSPRVNLSQVAEDLFKRTLLKCAQS